MIAWLLDPQGEHGLGTSCLDGLAFALAEKGWPRLRESLGSSPPAIVRTESPATHSRYDIEIGFAETTFVIENKVKTIGSGSQLRKYEVKGCVPIALGWCDVSFAAEAVGRHPLLTYQDVLAILEQLSLGEGDFHILVKHYRDFLRRELSLLTMIDVCYTQGTMAQHAQVTEQVESTAFYNENDLRFLNFFLLGRLRQRLRNSPLWKGADWRTRLCLTMLF